MRKPGFWLGILVGGLASAALIALFFVADAALGLPLVPFDIFDWIARVLPGDVITFGIDTMVDTLIALNFDLTVAAKLAEQAMAVGAMWAGGTVAGGVLFAILRWRDMLRGIIPGLILGLLAGVGAMLISLQVNQTASAGPVVGSLWILAVTLGWGALIGWSYERLVAAPAPAEAGEIEADELNRRQFLVRMGAGTAAVTVIGAGLASTLSRNSDVTVAEAPLLPEEGGSDGGEVGGAVGGANADEIAINATDMTEPLPNADAELEPAPGTRPEYTPVEDHYRIDINARPPRIDGETWRLSIDGMVDNPLELTIADLQAYEPVHRFVTLSCISNRLGGSLISTTLWTGARLSEVLADAGVQNGAQYITMYAEDGFHESLALDTLAGDDRIMLAYYWDGKPLTEAHGFPLRIYIPDRYGMKQPKWITRMVVTDEYEPGYWVVRNWDEVARVNTTSVIDVVATDAAYEENGQMFIPIGGIAYAGARGISQVQVRMDGGDWTDAEIRDPISDTTWALWRIDWPFSEGEHTFEVRCVDGEGNPQVERPADVRPSGATGIYSTEATL